MPKSINPKEEISIGKIIKEARIRKGYTQSKLSQLSGISVRTIGNIENGKQDPRYVNLEILADILETPKNLFPQLEQKSFSPSVQQFLDAFIDAEPAVQVIVAKAGMPIINGFHEVLEINGKMISK